MTLSKQAKQRIGFDDNYYVSLNNLYRLMHVAMFCITYTLLRSLWEGYKFLIATVVYLLPLLSGAKKHGYVKQLIQYGLTM